MKVIVAGGRGFKNYRFLSKSLKEELDPDEDNEIISGTAKGGDKLGERFAKQYGIRLKLFPADWDKHGKRAGYLRNVEMADYGDMLIAFWDGISKGTEHMINIAVEKGLIVIIKRY